MNKKKLSSESFFLLTNESLCLLLQIELTSFVVLRQFAGGERPEIVSGKHTRKIVFFCT